MEEFLPKEKSSNSKMPNDFFNFDVGKINFA